MIETPLEPFGFMHAQLTASNKCSFSRVQDFFRTTAEFCDASNDPNYDRVRDIPL